MKRNLWPGLLVLYFVIFTSPVSNSLLAADSQPGSIVIKKSHDFEVTGDGLFRLAKNQRVIS